MQAQKGNMEGGGIEPGYTTGGNIDTTLGAITIKPWLHIRFELEVNFKHE